MFAFIFSILIFFYLLAPASADLINPSYFSAECNPGEIMVECDTNISMYGVHGPNECLRYILNPAYRRLEGTGKGWEKFCYSFRLDPTFLFNFFISQIPYLFLTIIIESIVFLLLGVRGWRNLKIIFLMNILSVPVANSILAILNLGWLAIVYVEAYVIIFESWILTTYVKTLPRKKLVKAVIISNICSLFLGNFWVIIYSIQSIFVFFYNLTRSF